MRFGFVAATAPPADRNARRGQAYPAAIKWGAGDEDGDEDDSGSMGGSNGGGGSGGWFNPLTFKAGSRLKPRLKDLDGNDLGKGAGSEVAPKMPPLLIQSELWETRFVRNNIREPEGGHAVLQAESELRRFAISGMVPTCSGKGMLLPESIQELCGQTYVEVQVAPAFRKEWKDGRKDWEELVEADWAKGLGWRSGLSDEAQLTALVPTKPTDISQMMMHRVTKNGQAQLVKSAPILWQNLETELDGQKDTNIRLITEFASELAQRVGEKNILPTLADGQGLAGYVLARSGTAADRDELGREFARWMIGRFLPAGQVLPAALALVDGGPDINLASTRPRIVAVRVRQRCTRTGSEVMQTFLLGCDGDPDAFAATHLPPLPDGCAAHPPEAVLTHGGAVECGVAGGMEFFVDAIVEPPPPLTVGRARRAALSLRWTLLNRQYNFELHELVAGGCEHEGGSEQSVVSHCTHHTAGGGGGGGGLRSDNGREPSLPDFSLSLASKLFTAVSLPSGLHDLFASLKTKHGCCLQGTPAELYEVSSVSNPDCERVRSLRGSVPVQQGPALGRGHEDVPAQLCRHARRGGGTVHSRRDAVRPQRRGGKRGGRRGGSDGVRAQLHQNLAGEQPGSAWPACVPNRGPGRETAHAPDLRGRGRLA